MRDPAIHIRQYVRFWRLIIVAEGMLLGAGLAAAVWILSDSIILALSCLVLINVVWLVLRKPWNISGSEAADYLDNNVGELEFSTGLILQSPGNLSAIAQLQRNRISRIIPSIRLTRILPPNYLIRCALVAVIGLFVSFPLKWIWPGSGENNPSGEETILHYSVDSSSVQSPPRIVDAEVRAIYPGYTGMGSRTLEGLSGEVPEGTVLQWNVSVSGVVDSMMLHSPGNTAGHFSGRDSNEYTYRHKPMGRFLYSFRLVRDSLEALSDFYSIDLVPDKAPVIEPDDMQDFVEFDVLQGNKQVRVAATVTDDYGLADAYIVATVSKGDGESVKFREEVLTFNQVIRSRKSVLLSRTISLDSVGMGPGDELYYYIEAVDNRQPTPRYARSTTFFAVIRDTVEHEFMTGGGLGVDLMPDYFRSQRQIIIDTEALLQKKPSMDQQSFRQASNSLGYDQKLLRLKYGQYMGDEFESGITESAETIEDAMEEKDPDDPTAAYTHDHDNESEDAGTALPEEDHEHESEDPLERYMHEHSDPEEATLYTQGVRAMLKQAMAEMWDAELYLRLYEPEKSLPYQYKALDLIQKIKNHARIYVHRIGFDPPPIKEDSRLSGDLKEINSPRRTENSMYDDPYHHMQLAVKLLIQCADGASPPEASREEILRPAAEELAQLAVETPGKYLNTLSALQQLLSATWQDVNWRETGPQLAGELMQALPPGKDTPGPPSSGEWNRLDSLYQHYLERSIYE